MRKIRKKEKHNECIQTAKKQVSISVFAENMTWCVENNKAPLPHIELIKEASKVQDANKHRETNHLLYTSVKRRDQFQL
jgi:hypothetical protein